uniref:Protein kinase domain-containing protein n=1 Tax=Macrostomum lignano TaxID=282301 RepID=A0A1I8F634_9PLAT
IAVLAASSQAPPGSGLFAALPLSNELRHSWQPLLLADCAAQRIETLAGGSSAIRAHDWRRSGRLGLIGLIGAVPAHYWYLALTGGCLDGHLELCWPRPVLAEPVLLSGDKFPTAPGVKSLIASPCAVAAAQAQPTSIQQCPVYFTSPSAYKSHAKLKSTERRQCLLTTSFRRATGPDLSQFPAATRRKFACSGGNREIVRAHGPDAASLYFAAGQQYCTILVKASAPLSTPCGALRLCLMARPLTAASACCRCCRRPRSDGRGLWWPPRPDSLAAPCPSAAALPASCGCGRRGRPPRPKLATAEAGRGRGRTAFAHHVGSAADRLSTAALVAPAPALLAKARCTIEDVLFVTPITGAVQTLRGHCKGSCLTLPPVTSERNGPQMVQTAARSPWTLGLSRSEPASAAGCLEDSLPGRAVHLQPTPFTYSQTPLQACARLAWTPGYQGAGLSRRRLAERPPPLRAYRSRVESRASTTCVSLCCRPARFGLDAPAGSQTGAARSQSSAGVQSAPTGEPA